MAKVTRNQLKRRARIVEAVIDLIVEAGVEAVQMRSVAQRSGVALATVYKYFSSKEDLVAAALDDWQNRVVRPILADEPPAEDPLSGILDYLRRFQHAFHVDLEMTALTVQLAISTEPGAKVAINQMLCTNAEILDRLVDVVAPEDLRHVAFGLSGALTGALIGLLTGRMTLEELVSHVEWVARVLLGDIQPRTKVADVAITRAAAVTGESATDKDYLAPPVGIRFRASRVLCTEGSVVPPALQDQKSSITGTFIK
ncbi:hypothetical protein BMG05_08965 [Mycobacterium malmoense]|nr:hypothetical protein BMG05_08965 [Mycobacterium malmoense]